jgi:hypothetical protein
MLESFPDRFLFGTDAVATTEEVNYRKCYEDYAPLWKALSPETSRKIRLDNYERLFDSSRNNIRAWERAMLPELVPAA